MYREELPLLPSLTTWLPRLLVAGSVGLAACDAGDATAPTASTAAAAPEALKTCFKCAGRIAFASWVTGNAMTKIYSMNPDGSGRKQLTTASGMDSDPAWAPDYSHLVFRHADGLGGGLWTIKADGSKLVQITSDVFANGPAWGSSNRIAFASAVDFLTHADSLSEIYTMDPDGLNLVRLTNNVFNDRDPAWSPDGSKIAYASNMATDRRLHIFVMNADGTGVKQLTFGRGEQMPAWSADGTKIAYANAYNVFYQVQPAIHVMNADGSNDVVLIQGSLANPEVLVAQPTWSRTGQRIAFVSNKFGHWGIFGINPDGTGLEEPNPPMVQPVNDVAPSWHF